MSERLLSMARMLAETDTADFSALDRSVHMRDLKTIIKRLLEHIETLSK